MQSRPNHLNRKISYKTRQELDSSFYSLLDYAAEVEGKKVKTNDVHSLSNQRVKIEITNGLHRNFTDAELGYINVSPATVNQQLNQAVFFYELLGEGYFLWIVCTRRKQNRWVIVSKKQLAIS